MNRRELSPDGWRDLVAELDASGQSLKDFANEHGVKRAELWTWRQRVHEERADEAESQERAQFAVPKATPPKPAQTSTTKTRYVRTPAEREQDFILLIDALAQTGSAKLGALQSEVGRDRQVVRKMLKDAEALGIVYRTGNRSTTVWHLG